MCAQAVAHKELAADYPKRLLVVEKMTSLHAACAVFDMFNIFIPPIQLISSLNPGNP